MRSLLQCPTVGRCSCPRGPSRMLTPAEELGLSGLNLASRVRKAFFRMTEPRLVKLSERVRELSRQRRLFYLRDGQEEVIHTMLMPVTLLPEQMGYLHYI